MSRTVAETCELSIYVYVPAVLGSLKATQKSWRGLGSEAEANEKDKAKRAKSRRNWTAFMVISGFLFILLLLVRDDKSCKTKETIYRYGVSELVLINESFFNNL